jgi:two-component system alkaline phosphatase synthesis response regulator PhoP
MSTRVLVVDDELDTLNLLKTILEISGFEPITTLNSLDALTLAEVEQPDVVLLDIMMPKLDGFQLCKMMRKNEQTKDLPIIFVTAYSALDLKDRVDESEGDYVIHKPINIDLLVGAIPKIMEIRKKLNQKEKVQPPPTSSTSSKASTDKSSSDNNKVD